MNMETLPMPLDAMDGASARGLSEFRVDSPAEVNAFLRQIVAGNVLVQLSSPEGGHYNTTLWTADAARRVLSFAAQANDPGLQRLLESQEAVAVCYLDLVKLQWDLHDLMLVHGAQESALQARLSRISSTASSAATAFASSRWAAPRRPRACITPRGRGSSSRCACSTSAWAAWRSSCPRTRRPSSRARASRARGWSWMSTRRSS